MLSFHSFKGEKKPPEFQEKENDEGSLRISFLFLLTFQKSLAFTLPWEKGEIGVFILLSEWRGSLGVSSF